MKKILRNVSLITTVLNEAGNIREFMNSIIAQSARPLEFIIVDGGSTDGTYEILKEYAKKYKWIKVYQEKGASIGRGRNIAIEKAKGNIIAVTDAGCIVDKKWLEEITKPFFRNERVDVVVGIYKPYYTNDFEYFQGMLIVKSPEKIFGSPSRMSIRSISFRKKCWVLVGRLPEKYGGDDTLFNIKLLKSGCRFFYTKKAIVYWRMRKNLKSFVKQFYRYALGDVKYKNIFRLKKILGFQIFLSILILSLFVSFYYSRDLFILEVLMIFLINLFLGVIYLLKTKKLKSLIWIPVLFSLKTLAYYFGFIMGLIKMLKK